jgi:hypothetical protein
VPKGSRVRALRCLTDGRPRLAHWRDAWQIELVTGKDMISNRPATEEEWIRERATVVDVMPTN